MGRMATRLEVKIPTFFRCPISLELMQSPVSLCTGVTYDRASIQRWIDSGHATCPATMLPLPSTDLIPNLTLRRLINLWSHAAQASPSNLIRDIKSSQDPLPLLTNLADLLTDPDLDDSIKNNLFTSTESITDIASIIIDNGSEPALRIFALIFTTDCIEEATKRNAVSALISDLHRSITSVLFILKDGTTVDSRIDAARVLHALFKFSDPEAMTLIAETPTLFHELIRLIDGGKSAQEAAIACLIAASKAGRRARLTMVQAGVVPAMARVLAAAGTPAEAALRVMEAAAGCPDGRVAICEAAKETVGVVLERMMKVGREGQEAAMAVLWAVCHVAKDPRAMAAVMGASGGVEKILLLMQGDCSPATRRMAGDLVRLFRVNYKSCLAGYNTKTTHIMPF